MKETITIHCSINNITFTVLKEFEIQCPNYKDFATNKWIEKYNILKFLHNENGPAVIDHKSDIRTYFLDGRFIGNTVDNDEKLKQFLKERENK